MEPKCQYHIGCHNCPVEKLKEDFRAFRMALKQFLSAGDKKMAIQEGHSLVNKIDEWYEPHTSDYKPMFKEE